MSTFKALFEQPDPKLWESTTRSIRIDGTVTSVRLENFFWRVLVDMGGEEGLQTPQLLTKLSKQSIDSEYKLTNFTSFVRVCCGLYLDLKARKDVTVPHDSLTRDPLTQEVGREEMTE